MTMMKKIRYVIDLEKAKPTETEDGELTEFGMKVLHAYALRYVKTFERDLVIERRFPELAGTFQDVRTDPEYAFNHAQPL